MKSDRTLLRWYRRINKRFFDGACPDKVCIRWADPDNDKEKSLLEEKYFGWATTAEKGDPYHDYQILMCKSLNKKWSVKISTLVHEMVHLATNLRDDHGPAFERWRQYIADRGIFKKNALRKGMTLF